MGTQAPIAMFSLQSFTSIVSPGNRPCQLTLEWPPGDLPQPSYVKNEETPMFKAFVCIGSFDSKYARDFDVHALMHNTATHIHKVRFEYYLMMHS